MKDDKKSSYPTIAPVDIDMEFESPDVVSHSLKVLATVYHYNHWIFTSFMDFLGSSVLEVGAGMGNITQFLLNVDSVTCLEPYEPYRTYLSERFAQHLNVSTLPHTIEACPNEYAAEESFDSIICLNVLEHIDDDVDAVKRFYKLLKPGGKAIILTPALPCIHGKLDEALGHIRRYTTGSLTRVFNQAGLRPCYARYMNIVGAAGWWWRGKVRGKSTFPVSETLLFDKMVPLLSAMERIIPPIIGQSVIVVGKKE